jgi:hypothetical protein
MKRLLLAAVLLSVMALPLTATAKKWAQLQPGDIVQFLIPASADQPDPSSTTDKLVVSGGKIIDIDIGPNCGASIQPVQNYALIDSTGTRSPKEGGMIVLLDDPIKPGTLLSDPSPDFTCLIGGVEYIRYSGVVE